MSADKPCKDCGKEFRQYNTLQNRCFDCVRARYVQPKRKAVNKFGKQAGKWKEFRQEWIKKHATASGTWICALQISPLCPRTLTLDTLTLDHIEGRGRAPQLRYVDNNIQPSCFPCNGMKGSSKV